MQNKGEFDKYKLYIDELEKVMYLLLKLSGRLARAENAFMSLPPDADDKEKVSTPLRLSKILIILCHNYFIPIFCSQSEKF